MYIINVKFCKLYRKEDAAWCMDDCCNCPDNTRHLWYSNGFRYRKGKIIYPAVCVNTMLKRREIRKIFKYHYRQIILKYSQIYYYKIVAFLHTLFGELYAEMRQYTKENIGAANNI